MLSITSYSLCFSLPCMLAAVFALASTQSALFDPLSGPHVLLCPWCDRLGERTRSPDPWEVADGRLDALSAALHPVVLTDRAAAAGRPTEDDSDELDEVANPAQVQRSVAMPRPRHGAHGAHGA